VSKSKKILLGALIGAVALSSTMIIVNANSSVEDPYNLPSFYNSSDYFKSNKHTNYFGAHNTDCPQFLEKDDEEFMTTSKGTWYIDKNDLSFKFVTNDGFVHSSKVTKRDANGNNRGLNSTNYHASRSPIYITYYNTKDDSANKSTYGLPFFGYDNEEGEVINYTEFDFNKTENGFYSNIKFKEVGISLKLQVEFLEDSVRVSIPFSSIKEETKDYSLASVRVYHYFGAVEKPKIDSGDIRDTVTGYNFIPDGVGALVRFNEVEENAPSGYRKRIYGNDLGLPTAASLNTSLSTISMPIFGYVQGENSNACLSIIESGAEYCDIVSEHPYGRFTFYRSFPEFFYREVYSQKISGTSSIPMVQADMNNFDISVTYKFLEDENASYVGMAKAYRDYLINNEKLNTENKYEYNRIPLRVDTIGNEVTNGVMFDKTITMTTFEEYADIISTLKNEYDITNVIGVFKGYTNDGLSWTSPMYNNISKRLGSIYSLNLDNIYFHTDHLYASVNQSGYNQGKDLANSINVQLITEGSGDSLKYMLTPEYTKERIEKDLSKLKDKGVKNFALDNIGDTLNSNFGENPTTRVETLEAYKDVVSSIDSKIALYSSNEYLLKYIDRNFDYSMYNNQYLIFDDTVPFTSIVQSGSIELFSTYINFFGNVREDLLRMIDYNVYPSFLLTKESSSLLDETALQYIYCSQFDNLEEAVHVYYDFVSGALNNVIGATIVNREIIEDGVVKVSYSNGKAIIVNYKNVEVTVDGTKVPMKGYEVI